MTRIGFAYNQKPLDTAADSAAALARDEEPPSSGSGIATLLAPSAALASSDEFAEWDSEATINAVASALEKHGTVIRLEATDDFPLALRDACPDIVFNIAEGLRGPNREAHVPAICEFYGIPYSGSDPFTLSACLDKTRTKELLRARGVRTVDWWLIRSLDEMQNLVIDHCTYDDDDLESTSTIRLASGQSLTFPLFAKPVHEGSSKGITERNFISNEFQLFSVVEELLDRYQQPVIVEAFLSGAEFTCGVLGNGASARMLPIVALNFSALPKTALPIYGFEAKWLWDRPENPLDIFECPAKIPLALEGEIEKEVLGAYQALGCRDWSRIDVRLDAGGAPHIIEVNPLPGILPDAADNSCLPKAARAAGLDYDALIGSALQAAADRNGILLSGARP